MIIVVTYCDRLLVTCGKYPHDKVLPDKNVQELMLENDALDWNVIDMKPLKDRYLKFTVKALYWDHLMW
jgi:hypothetical protein